MTPDKGKSTSDANIKTLRKTPSWFNWNFLKFLPKQRIKRMHGVFLIAKEASRIYRENLEKNTAQSYWELAI
ncbi:unnamed protein product, partial [Larinioides sclopetarius]